jgi:hypothetical protein
LNRVLRCCQMVWASMDSSVAIFDRFLSTASNTLTSLGI